MHFNFVKKSTKDGYFSLRFRYYTNNLQNSDGSKDNKIISCFNYSK